MVLQTVVRKNSKKGVKIVTLPLCSVDRTYTDSIVRSATVKKVILSSLAAFALVAVFCMGKSVKPLTSLPTTDDIPTGRVLLGEGDTPRVSRTIQGSSTGNNSRTQNMNAASSSSNKFHLTDIIHPETLQPFWLMPISGSLMVVLTVKVFGFSVRFEQPKEQKTAYDTMSMIMKTCASIAFIAMALNCWRQDLKKWNEVPGNGFKSSFCLGSVILFKSSNYKAGLVIWVKIMLQNPGTLFGKTPTYLHIPCLQFPLSPFGAAWMDPLKWLYALILLPYFVPALLIFGICTCCLCCRFYCVICAFNAKMGGCCCWMLLTIISLGLWSGAREHFAIYWHDVWPMLYVGYAQLWATVVGYSIALIYAGIVAGGKGDARSSLLEADGESVVRGAGLGKVFLKDEERTDGKCHLWDIQPVGTKKDFGDYSNTNVETAEVDQEEAIKMKVSLVFCLINFQMIVVTTQFFVFFICRIILGEDSVTGIIEAARETASERTTKAYVAYLTLTAQSYGTLGFQKFQAFWNAL